MSVDVWLEGAREALALARHESLAKPGSERARERKSDASPVTEVDLAVERLLRAELGRRFPDHGLQGEEFPAERPDARFQWIMDPIDGTISFSRDVPLWGTILGLHEAGEPVLGLIDMPALDRACWAARGQGAFVNGVRQRLAPVEDMADELVVTGDRSQFARVGELAAFDALLNGHERVRTYPDCFGHVLALTGAAGAVVDFSLAHWDLAATQVLIEEAGGTYAIVGERPAPSGGVWRDMVAGKPAVVAHVLEIMGKRG